MEKLNFDTAYSELQQILINLQDEDIDIEKMSAYVKRAKELSDFCKKRLRTIEKDIDKINIEE